MRKTFYDFHSAVKYQRYLKSRGIDSTICEAYNWQEQATTYSVVPERSKDGEF